MTFCLPFLNIRFRHSINALLTLLRSGFFPLPSTHINKTTTDVWFSWWRKEGEQTEGKQSRKGIDDLAKISRQERAKGRVQALGS